jgi:hypothetical protein
MSFLRQVAHEKKDLVKKWVEFFSVLIEGEKFSLKDLKNAWIDSIKVIVFLCSISLSNLANSPSVEMLWP